MVYLDGTLGRIPLFSTNILPLTGLSFTASAIICPVMDSILVKDKRKILSVPSGAPYL